MNTQHQSPYRRGNATSAIMAAVGTHGAPSVSLRAHIGANSGIALASFNVVYDGSKNPSATAAAIEALLDYEVNVIPGSLREISTANNSISVVTARLVGKQKTLFLADAETVPENFTALSKNLFMDADDKMWDLQSAGGRTTLVRKENVEGNDEMDALLKRFAPITASSIKAADHLVDHVHALASSLEEGTMISYVHPVNHTVKLGFCLSSDNDHIEVVPEIGSVEKVPLGLITNGFNADAYASKIRLPDHDAIASYALTGREAMISYYRKVFGMNEEFFSKWTNALQAMSL